MAGYLEKGGSESTDTVAWKCRFFVLPDHLRWYASEEEFQATSAAFHGLISLSCFFVSSRGEPNSQKSQQHRSLTQSYNQDGDHISDSMYGIEDEDDYQFILFTFPKSLVVRAQSEQEREMRIQALQTMCT